MTWEQYLYPHAFVSKSLSATEERYSNIEWEALGILHGLDKFHHYYFSREVNKIINYKPLIAMFKKMQTHCQRTYNAYYSNSSIHGMKNLQDRTDLFIADYLPRQTHKENKDDEILGMKIYIWCDTHNNRYSKLHDYTTTTKGMTNDDHLQHLKR